MSLSAEIEDLRRQIQMLTIDAEATQRTHRFEIEDTVREHRLEVDELRRTMHQELERHQQEHRVAIEALERHYDTELEQQRKQASRDVTATTSPLSAICISISWRCRPSLR